MINLLEESYHRSTVIHSSALELERSRANWGYAEPHVPILLSLLSSGFGNFSNSQGLFLLKSELRKSVESYNGWIYSVPVHGTSPCRVDPESNGASSSKDPMTIFQSVSNPALKVPYTIRCVSVERRCVHPSP